MNPAASGWRFRGWRVVGGAAGIQFLQAALMNQAFGAYIALLGAEKGWSKTALSGAAALQSAESALLGPAIGWIVDRFGARGMVRIGILVFGLGMMALSQVQTIGALYAVVLLIALGTSGGGYFPLTVAVVQWFNRQRARALSAMSMGMAAGGMMVPLVAWSMQTWGWRHAALGSGLIIILVGWPLAKHGCCPIREVAKCESDSSMEIGIGNAGRRRACSRLGTRRVMWSSICRKPSSAKSA